MDIMVGDIYCQVAQPRKNARTLAIIRDVCRARPDGFKYMPKYRAGVWDGYISLMKGMSYFPTGLLRLVMNALSSNRIDFHLVSIRSNHAPYSAIRADMLNGVELRGYQLGAVVALLDASRGVAKMATNSGKTEVMAAIIKALHYPKTLVIVHRKELMYQTAERFADRLGVKVGMIGDGIWIHNDVTVAMIQTLSNPASKPGTSFADNTLLMVDECHHASSDQMLSVLFKIPGFYRFGFSGTPLRHDILADMKLMAATGEIVYEVTNRDMIKWGYSAKPKIIIDTIYDNDKKLWDLPYDQAYELLVVDNVYRNKRIAEISMELKGVTLIIVSQIRHGEALKELIPEATFVHGSMSTEYRRSVLDAMRSAKSGIFIASPIFDEGVDVPAMNNVVLACGGKSDIKLLQRIGRGLRSKNGANVLTVVDFIDDTNDYLLTHSDDRIDAYVEEGFETCLI